MDQDITKNAEYYIDKHFKIILEATQLLNNAMPKFDPTYVPIYKFTHLNHPLSKWVAASSGNFEYVCRVGLALCKEYTYRYNKTYKCQAYIQNFHNKILEKPLDQMTPFVQCMPDKYKGDDPIAAYRKYYKYEKAAFAKWTKRSTPEWFLTKE